MPCTPNDFSATGYFFMPFLLYTHCFLCDWVYIVVFLWHTQCSLFIWVFLRAFLLYTQYFSCGWVCFMLFRLYTQYFLFAWVFFIFSLYIPNALSMIGCSSSITLYPSQVSNSRPHSILSINLQTSNTNPAQIHRI